jgi:VCBS repeat-containing protein
MNTNKIGTLLLGDRLTSERPFEIESDLFILQKAESLALQELQSIARSSDFNAKMKVAFGEGIDVTQLQAAWAAGDFSAIPKIEVRSRSDINGANGAYARAIDTIFIGQEFLNQNAGNVDAIARVVLEEIGHAIDAWLNSDDSIGDEGAIFSALVRGETLTERELAALRAEDDSATVTLDGQVVAIEQNASTNVSEIGNYTKIYQLDIPNDANYEFDGTPSYSINNSATVFPRGISRIGYYLELDNGSGSQWVWSSMDAFTQDLAKIGVPTRASGAFWQQIVNNMNVESNVPGIVTGQGIATGNIEFWPYAYRQPNGSNIPGASDVIYDFGDQIDINPAFGAGYGSMQIHNYGAGQTLLAWNRWSFSDSVPSDDLGIGNYLGNNNPDWTFNYNSSSYTVKNLEVWVQPNTSSLNSFIRPVSYDMLNGEAGFYQYWDENYTGTGQTTVDLAPLSGGLGDLTDSTIATDNWNVVEAPPGNGPYVGWLTINPTITFNFDSTVTINTVTIYVDDANGFGNVRTPASAIISMGGTTLNRAIADPSGSTPTLVTFSNLGLTGTSLDLTLNRQSESWVFLSEVTFEGQTINTPTEGDDTLFGTPGNDTIDGLGGNDQIFGLGGNDSLDGNLGNDTIDPGLGIDTVNGGDGNDLLVVDYSSLTTDISSTNSGNSGTISTVGNSVNYSNIERMNLSGGSGNDTILGTSGNDTIFGNAGRDYLVGNDGDDSIDGGANDDTLDGGSGNNTLNGGAGDDTFNVIGTGTAIGGDGNDIFILSGPYTGSIDGGGGSDRIEIAPSYSGDIIFPGAIAGIEAVVVQSSSGNDYLIGGDGNDSLDGQGGNDTLEARGGNDTLIGGTGNDLLNPGLGIDTVDGGADNDLLVVNYSSLSTDVSSSHNNGSGSISTTDNRVDYSNIERLNLTTGSGNDVLIGAGKNDTLAGGTGSDLFVLGDVSWLGYDDRNPLTDGTGDYASITDFKPTEGDIIQLQGSKSNYLLEISGSDTRLSIDKPGSEPDELVAIIQGVTNLNLDANYFVFVQPTNTPPTTSNQTLTTDEDTNLVFSASNFNFSDVDAGDSLQAVRVDTLPTEGILYLDTNNNGTVDTGEALTQGSLVASEAINASQFKFKPDANENGTPYANFTFSVSDGKTFSTAPATMTLNITPVNDVPVAQNDAVTTNEDTVLNGNVLANNGSGVDSDVDGDTLTITQVLNSAANVGTQITLASGALLTVNADGTFNYNPNGKFEVLKVGETATENFTYTVSDGNGGTDTATVTITINGVNDPPTLAQEIPDQTAIETTAFTYQIPANTFADVDDNILAYSISNLPDGLTFNPATRTIGGTPTNNTAGTYNITVTATDPVGASASDTFTLTVVDSINLVNGTSGNDTLNGSDSIDYLNGLAGNDTLNGLGGNDRLDGGTGSDRLVGGAGDDLYIVDNTGDVVVENASEGLDTVQSSVSYTLAANVENLILTGGANRNGTGNSLANVMTGNSGNNLLRGLDGNDTLNGLAGQDTLEGGTGNDILDGGEGIDQVRESANVNFFLTNTSLTGNGTDSLSNIETASLTGGSSNNNLNASAFTLGSVTLNGGAGNDTLTGGSANDVLTGGTGNDTINGSDGLDRLVESANVNFTLTNTSLTGNGTDSLSNIETASLTGGSSNNNLNASAFTLGSVTLNGGAGNDTLTGSSANDVLTGGTGNDTINGSDGLDRLVESGNVNFTLTNTSLMGNGTDSLSNIETASLTGGSSNNNLNASAFTLGSVTLDGGAGNDKLLGGTGNDILVGRAGNDTLTGGSGQDFFTFSSPNDKLDSITDFNSTDDTIRVDDVVFGGGLVVGTLLESQFVLGTAAADTSDRFIYNQGTGALFFDADGTGTSAQIQIATLTTKPVIGFEDILVI